MAVAVNVPVLVGPVQLLYVQSMTISEGYRIERIASSRFSQATQPTNKTITIEAVLLGPQRLTQKKHLEAIALTSRILVAAAAPALATTGIPVVSGLTISLDMQVTDLRFTQSVAKRDALDVSITLQHVPRSSLSAVIGEVADLSLAAATAGVPTIRAANPIARTLGAPI
jgi:cellobiose-specific phosphotransferase system component IIB